jgi:membrane protease YdiL (CAAX protease family)
MFSRHEGKCDHQGRCRAIGSLVTMSAPGLPPQAESPERAQVPGDPLYARPPYDLSSARIWFMLALGGFLAGYVASAILLTIFAAASGNLKDLSQLESLSVPPWWVTIAGLVGLWMGFLTAVFLASRLRGSGRPAVDMGLRIVWWDVPLGILIGVAGQLLVALLYLPFEHLDPGLSHELSEPGNRLTGGFHGSDLAVIAVLTIVVVPIVEELFFRGLLLQSLVRLCRGAGRILGPLISVLATGILFGLAHAEPVELAGLALFGVVLSVMAYKTGRLGGSMFAHAAFNAFAVIAISTQGRIG